jgi:hypothetical protein
MCRAVDGLLVMRETFGYSRALMLSSRLSLKERVAPMRQATRQSYRLKNSIMGIVHGLHSWNLLYILGGIE